MKVLIFGGTRFMGRYVLRALRDVGVEVTIANRGTREENKGAHNVICDRSQPGALDQFKDSEFDAVIDFSAYASDWVEEAGKFFAGKVSRYVFISTGAVYTSSQVFPITEDFPKGPPHPFAPYAAEKIRSEKLLRDFNSQGAFDTTALRLPFVLGPDNYEDRESFVFSRLLSNEPIFLATKLFDAGSMLQFVNFSITTGFASVSKKFLTKTSKLILLNDKLAIETLISTFAESPSEIEMNLNNL